MSGKSFLHAFEKFGIDLGRVALGAVNTVGPVAAGTLATTFGGPLAGSLVKTLVGSVIAAEKSHVAAGEPKTPAGQPDPRKQQVLQNFQLFAPVIEVAAAVFGHPITNKPLFEEALTQAIDAVVAGLNASAHLLESMQQPAAA